MFSPFQKLQGLECSEGACQALSPTTIWCQVPEVVRKELPTELKALSDADYVDLRPKLATLSNRTGAILRLETQIEQFIVDKVKQGRRPHKYTITLKRSKRWPRFRTFYVLLIVRDRYGFQLLLPQVEDPSIVIQSVLVKGTLAGHEIPRVKRGSVTIHGTVNLDGATEVYAIFDKGNALEAKTEAVLQKLVEATEITQQIFDNKSDIQADKVLELLSDIANTALGAAGFEDQAKIATGLIGSFVKLTQLLREHTSYGQDFAPIVSAQPANMAYRSLEATITFDPQRDGAPRK